MSARQPVSTQINRTCNAQSTMITPFIFQGHFGISPVAYGYVILGIALGLFLGTFSNIFLLNYFKPKHLVRVGLSLSLLANLSLLLMTHCLGNSRFHELSENQLMRPSQKEKFLPHLI